MTDWMIDWKPNPILTSKEEWFIVHYGEKDGWDWYGLLANDGLSRGIPEGPKSSWLELISAIKDNEEFSEKRLAYTPGEGIYSPRSTNDASEKFYFDENDVEWLELLLDNPTSWREDNLKANYIKNNKGSK